MQGQIAAIHAANKKSKRGSAADIDPNRFVPERQLRLIKRDVDGNILELPFCVPLKGESCVQRIRSFCWNLFEHPEESWLSHWVNVFVMGCICLSAVVMVVESIPGIHKQNTTYWDGIEAFFVLTFSAEFAMRLIGCPDYSAFWCSGMNWVDLLSILPWYLDFAMSNSDVAALKILRLGRSLRLVKLSRYSSGVRLIIRSLEQSMDALWLFLFILLILVIVCSSAIYYTDRGEYDEATELYMRKDPIRGYLCCAGNSTAPCQAGIDEWSYPSSADFTCEQLSERSPFQSIPESFWWCLVTLTTVGYGDVYPVTYAGQVMGIFTMLLGVITLALPISIIGGSFIDERSKLKKREISESMNEKNTVPGAVEPVTFPVPRVEVALEGMDFLTAELTRTSRHCEVSVVGLMRLKERFSKGSQRLDPAETHHSKGSQYLANAETIDVSSRTMEVMEKLLASTQQSLDDIRSHLE